METAPVPAEPAPAPTPSVRVVAEHEVLVEHRESATSPWKHICASPCSFTPAGGEYRVIGVNVSPSAPFAVSGPGTLEVDIGSAPTMRRGMWITGAGAGVFALGLAIMFASSGFASLENGSGPNGLLRDEKIAMLGTGTVFTFAGLLASFYGFGLFYNNRRSTVSGPIADVSARKTGFTSPLSFQF